MHSEAHESNFIITFIALQIVIGKYVRTFYLTVCYLKTQILKYTKLPFAIWIK